MSFLSRFHAGSIFTKTGFALFFLLVLGLGLRLWGIGFGLPYEYHVDEVQYVRQAASMGQRGLEPVWWNNPPFYKYLFLLAACRRSKVPVNDN